MTTSSPQFVADAIQHGLTKIRVERILLADFNPRQSFECLRQRLLKDVLGIRNVTRPPRETPVRPGLERLTIAIKEVIERGRIARARLEQKFR